MANYYIIGTVELQTKETVKKPFTSAINWVEKENAAWEGGFSLSLTLCEQAICQTMRGLHSFPIPSTTYNKILNHHLTC